MAAIGFKAVHGGRISGVQRVTPEVLAAMEEMSRRRAGPQSAVHHGDAAAWREAAGDSAGGGVRDRLSRDDRRSAAALRRAVRVGREVAHQALGLSRREPSLHRQRTAELLGRDDLRIISCHLGGSSSPVRDSRRQQSVATTHGHEPADGLAAQQPRRRFRSVRLAADHAGRRASRWTRCSTTWPSKAGCWA